MPYFFRAEQLSVGYDGKPIVQDVEVSLEKGQILALIGPNGSGKSTILKSIVRQLKILGGTVHIGSHAISDISPRDLAKQAAVVLTERPKPELMTCEDVVAAGRYPYTGALGILSAEDKAKVHEALERVNALDIRHRSFTEISDGQLQRVLLARAICQEPEIIILDEPTSFLDIRYAVEILDILQRMAKENDVTVIMSLHELYYAKRTADLVMGIKSGRVYALGTPDDVFREEVISPLYDLPDGLYAELFGGVS